jgi:protein-S-isoprenylcysteine O-methyltransferase Ste14
VGPDTPPHPNPLHVVTKLRSVVVARVGDRRRRNRIGNTRRIVVVVVVVVGIVGSKSNMLGFGHREQDETDRKFEKRNFDFDFVAVAVAVVAPVVVVVVALGILGTVELVAEHQKDRRRRRRRVPLWNGKWKLGYSL